MVKINRSFFQNLPLFFLLIPWGNASELTHFARATTDTAFKVMMSDLRIAEALVNSLFADIGHFANVHIDPVRITSTGEITIPLQGKKANATMDYHGLAQNKDHVIIEMQIMHHDNFDRRALFYAASTFARQKFEGGSEWHSQIKNVYAIQFVDYSTDDKNMGQFRKYYRMTDWLSQGKKVIDGICLIQIELAGTKEIASKVDREEQLTPAEWWYYMIENSESFTDERVIQYRNLGMPQEIESALEKLKFTGWSAKDKEIYREEIREVDTYNGELERRESKGKREGEIESLMDGFLEGNISTRLLERIQRQNVQFSKELVLKIWNKCVAEDLGIPQDAEPFIEFLRSQGILEPDREEIEQSESEEKKL
ncbi:MAG: Rpn family recombination-promoting nuclease/putative transposase [Puniceicoccales bacterium]|jgi:predicted transposase/invertase (TIGR01784 family)|nr:Rpn family recombination-promoting nuclease/putative transposase [Puniceicoccales bacterium]